MWRIAARALQFMEAGRIAAPGRSEDPIRAELFSPERLETHAQTLAAAQPVAADGHPAAELRSRARNNRKVLVGSYERP